MATVVPDNGSALFLCTEKNVHVQKTSTFFVHVHEILHVCTKNYVHILILYFWEQDAIMFIFFCTYTKSYKIIIFILCMYKEKCTYICTYDSLDLFSVSQCDILTLSGIFSSTRSNGG